ncbi:hypothetical protein [Streptomyces sp. NPDC058872]|uniref:hypothetical protein n=1 Tax=Streptomyces sp. NPDC058872 TaxID=3346661 RepID=UPI0036965D29
MTVRRRAFVTLLASGIAVVAVAGCGGADAQRAPVERKAFAFAGGALTIDSDDSKLVIAPADIDEVRVERQVDGWVFMGSGPEASWKLVDGRLTLRVVCDAVAASCAAVHRIQVPRRVTVTVEEDNGGVVAEGLSTPLKVRSGNGNVRVVGASADLDLGSDNGSVVVEGSVTAPRVTARSGPVRSGNGDVRITLGAVPRAVDVVTDNGDVTVGLPTAVYEVSGSSGNGRVRLGVPRGDGSGRSVNLRSNNGDVTARTVN